jgi:DNA-binding MarR family transcriptional regulator
VTGPDEVDRLVAAWRRERPDLDVEPLTVLSRVSRLARHLDRARRAAFAEHGLAGYEFDVLAALRRAGAPYRLTPGQLMVATLVASGTMTHRLDQLERRGLVARRAAERDRRTVQVELTDAGRDAVDAAFADLLERERALLAGIPAAQRTALADQLHAVLAPFDAADAPQPDADATGQ